MLKTIIVAVGLALVAASAQAQAPTSAPRPAQKPPLTGTLKKINDTGIITLGFREASVPFSSKNAEGKPGGYSVDLCLNVVEQLKYDMKRPIEVRWLPVTIANRFQMVTSGRIDMECGSSTNTLARRKLVDFSLLTFVDGATLLYRTDRGLSESSNFAGRRIAVVPGSTSEKAIQTGFAKVTPKPVIVAVKDHDEGRDKLASGEVDAYCSDRTILIGLGLQMPNPREFAILEQFLSYEPYGLVLRRGDPDFRLEVDRALARLYRSGEVGEIYRYWFGANPPTGLLRAMYMLASIPE